MSILTPATADMHRASSIVMLPGVPRLWRPASRPLIDAGWMPKTRQVGKSGLKVSPKVYLALGISGAPEHIEGMKGAATIIAVNTDKHAPIFGVAHYGLVEDLFDVCEELTEQIEERQG